VGIFYFITLRKSIALHLYYIKLHTTKHHMQLKVFKDWLTI